jgi:hypothetical protein
MSQPKGPLALVDGTKVPPPARPLNDAGLSLWRRVHSDFEIEDVGGLELLLLAAEATDMVDAYTKIIAADGPTARTQAGLRAHPLLKEITAGRSFITRTLGRLGITSEQARPVGRPSGKGFAAWTGE